MPIHISVDGKMYEIPSNNREVISLANELLVVQHRKTLTINDLRIQYESIYSNLIKKRCPRCGDESNSDRNYSYCPICGLKQIEMGEVKCQTN